MEEIKLSHIKIGSDSSGHVSRVKLELDGRKLSSVKSFKIEASGDATFARVTIEMYACVDLDIHADTDVKTKEIPCKKD